MKHFGCFKVHVVVVAFLFLHAQPIFSQSKSPDINGIDFESIDTYVEYTSAQVFGKLRISDHPERITGITVCYGLTMDDLSHNEKASFDLLNGFSATLTSLEDGVLYYYVVVINVGQKHIESGVKYFFTFAKGPVDLDLPSGNKWASHNVGASTPTENGDYFAWGETAAKSLYNWSTYKHCSESTPTRTLFSKYTTVDKSAAKSKTDNMVTLELEDDAAYINMGPSWMTPTDKDWKELRDHCIVTTIEVNKVRGILISSKKDPNNYKKSIFISAYSGGIVGTQWQTDHLHALYWSSNLAVYAYSSDKEALLFSTDNTTKMTPRYCGLNVRAITRTL